METEAHDKMIEDSDCIFTAVSTGAFNNITEAKQIVVMAYAPDLSFSRAGIIHALKRLEEFYNAENKTNNQT